MSIETGTRMTALVGPLCDAKMNLAQVVAQELEPLYPPGTTVVRTNPPPRGPGWGPWQRLACLIEGERWMACNTPRHLVVPFTAFDLLAQELDAGRATDAYVRAVLKGYAGYYADVRWTHGHGPLEQATAQVAWLWAELNRNPAIGEEHT